MEQQAASKLASPNTLIHKPVPCGILQRKCACGGSPGLTGECENCQENKLSSRTRLQTKLAINEPGDIYEREADRIADQVMAASPNPGVSGAPVRIQRYTGQASIGTDAAPSSVDHVLASSGTPLDPTLRREMEHRFGHDFSQVRVHYGAAAEQSARDVNANAYTVGHDIVFGAGRFASGTHEGRRLIAHELTHVVQQSGANQKHSQFSNAAIRSTSDTRPLSNMRIQRQETSGEDTKPRDESLGFGESLVIESLAAGATVGMPLLRPVVKGGVTGFYTEVRHQVKEGKGGKFLDRVKQLLVSPTDMLAYGKGYVWGILQGLWSPVQGIIDLVKLAWTLQQWQMQTFANVIRNFHEIVAMQGSLIERFSKLGDKAKVFFEGVKSNAVDFIARMLGAISGGVFELAKDGGRKAGQAIFKFLEKPWREIGEGIGIVVGTVLVEVLLAVFSGGLGNALTKVGQVLSKVAPTLMKGIRFIATELGTIIREIHAVVETIKAGLAKAGRSLLKGLEEFIGEVGTIFDDLVAMLKKLFTGAEDAAAKLPVVEKEAASAATAATAKGAAALAGKAPHAPKPAPKIAEPVMPKEHPTPHVAAPKGDAAAAKAATSHAGDMPPKAPEGTVAVPHRAEPAQVTPHGAEPISPGSHGAAAEARAGEAPIAKKRASGGHDIEVTNRGIEVCSPAPCPLLDVEYARELAENPLLAEDFKILNALRKTDPEKAALKSAELQRLLEIQRQHGQATAAELEGFQAWLREEGFTGPLKAAGDPVKLGPHGKASYNRSELGVSGKDVQSAHNAPQSVMKGVPGYNKDHALTVLMERDSHSGMDRYWKDTFQDLRRNGRTDATAQEIHDIVAESIRRTPGMGPGEKNTLIARLSDELFVEFGLLPGDRLPLPYPNIKP